MNGYFEIDRSPYNLSSYRLIFVDDEHGIIQLGRINLRPEQADRLREQLEHGWMYEDMADS